MTLATLTANQTSLLAERAAAYRRRGVIAWIESGGLALLAIIGATAAHIDWSLLTVLHSTYADESHAATAYALSGLAVVFALHAISITLKSRALDRALAIIAVICAGLFLLGTCCMIGTIALTQGLGEIGQSLPDIDAFFAATQTVVDDAFGAGVFEQLMLDLSVPLFTASVCTAFYLTTYLLKAIVELLVRRVPAVVQIISEARESAGLYRAIDLALARESRALAGLETAQARRDHWQPSRVADVVVAVAEEMLRPFDALVTGRQLAGRSSHEDLPIPHADGGPALDIAQLERRLAEIREATQHGRLLKALQEA